MQSNTSDKTIDTVDKNVNNTFVKTCPASRYCPNHVYDTGNLFTHQLDTSVQCGSDVEYYNLFKMCNGCANGNIPTTGGLYSYSPANTGPYFFNRETNSNFNNIRGIPYGPFDYVVDDKPKFPTKLITATKNKYRKHKQNGNRSPAVIEEETEKVDNVDNTETTTKEGFCEGNDFTTRLGPYSGLSSAGQSTNRLSQNEDLWMNANQISEYQKSRPNLVSSINNVSKEIKEAFASPNKQPISISIIIIFIVLIVCFGLLLYHYLKRNNKYEKSLFEIHGKTKNKYPLSYI